MTQRDDHVFERGFMEHGSTLTASGLPIKKADQRRSNSQGIEQSPEPSTVGGHDVGVRCRPVSLPGPFVVATAKKPLA
jgi:hypothetical protein